MNKSKVLKFVLIVVIILISLPLIYLAYDRAIMPPKPNWPIPSFTPDPENTLKINWLWGKGNNYYLTWVEAHKENNALVHYINAFSAMTIPENADGDIGSDAQDHWIKPFPEVEKAIQLNQKVLEEVRLGVQMRNCVLPPNPYSFSRPTFNFILIRQLARLIAVTGRQYEYEKKYSEALQYYVDGMQFGKDIAPKDQNLVTHMVSQAIIDIQLRPLLELIISNNLSDKDLKQIITECARIEKEQATFADSAEIEYKTAVTLLNDINEQKGIISNQKNKSFGLMDIYYFLNKGHVLRNYVKYNDEFRDALATKPYPEFIQIDWIKKVSHEPLNKLLIPNFAKAYTQHNKEIRLLRLAQIDAAIRLYHRDKTQWPKSIDALKPNYLPEIPLDPFINQPFKLAEDSTGMFAYSIGPDLKDDQAKIIYGTDTADHQRGDIK